MLPEYAIEFSVLLWFRAHDYIHRFNYNVLGFSAPHDLKHPQWRRTKCAKSREHCLCHISNLILSQIEKSRCVYFLTRYFSCDWWSGIWPISLSFHSHWVVLGVLRFVWPARSRWWIGISEINFHPRIHSSQIFSALVTGNNQISKIQFGLVLPASTPTTATLDICQGQQVLKTWRLFPFG